MICKNLYVDSWLLSIIHIPSAEESWFFDIKKTINNGRIWFFTAWTYKRKVKGRDWPKEGQVDLKKNWFYYVWDPCYIAKDEEAWTTKQSPRGKFLDRYWGGDSSVEETDIHVIEATGGDGEFTLHITEVK